MDEARDGNSPELEEGEEKQGASDALIVFGFGIQDPLWMRKQKEAAERGEEVEGPNDSRGWMLSLGAKMRVQAAAELYLQGATREVIFTGGATRQKDGLTQTEAELMQDYFLHILRKRKFEQLKGDRSELNDVEKRDAEVASEDYIRDAATHLIKEDQATNTIENFSRTLSMFEKNPDRYKNGVDLLSSKFHIDRIGQLADQFMLDSNQEYGAEDEIVRARQGKRHEALTNQVVNEYMNSDEYFQFSLSENRWRGGLRKVPEYFLPQTVFVSVERLKAILSNMAEQEAIYATRLQEMGIDPDNLDDLSEEQLAQLQDKIQSIERFLPPEALSQKNPPEVFSAPPAQFEKRSEFTDPIERARNLEKLVFSDVDGTLHVQGANERLVGEYIRLAERCSGEVVLTSSKSLGDLERLKNVYKMSELAPVIYENGAGVAFSNKIVSAELLKQVAAEEGMQHINFVENDQTIIAEFSPRRETLRPAFDKILDEMGLEAHYVLDLPAEKIAALYSVSLEQAQEIKDQAPQEKKSFMENVIFEEAPSEEQQADLIAKARAQGLHLTRARITWHLLSANVHKGEAVKFVQAVYRRLSPKYQTSIAIGDAPNDYEMFKQCDEAYYVGDDELQVQSSRPTEKKGPDGAIEVIRGTFLNMEAK